MDLPRPGLVGRTLRLALATALGFLGLYLFTDGRALWGGDIPWSHPGFLAALAVVIWFWRPAINELLMVPWGWRTTLVTATVVGIIGGIGYAAAGSAEALGWGLWVWLFTFALIAGVSHLLAAIVGTPGCEVRVWHWMWARIRCQDPKTVACEGWIDRFDGVRLFGKV